MSDCMFRLHVRLHVRRHFRGQRLFQGADVTNKHKTEQDLPVVNLLAGYGHFLVQWLAEHPILFLFSLGPAVSAVLPMRGVAIIQINRGYTEVQR
jgi:hypothetical protein